MRRNTNQVLAAMALDILCLVVTVYLSSWLRTGLPFGRFLPEVTQEMPLLLEALLIYPLVFLLVSLYDPDRVLTEWDEFLVLVTGCAVAGLALAGLIYFSIREISRLLLVYFFWLHFLLVSGWRSLARLFIRHSPTGANGKRHVLLVGNGRLAQQVLERLWELPGRQMELVGFMADDPAEGQQLSKLPCLGRTEDAIRVVQQQQVEDVLIALDGESHSRVRQVVTSLVETTCNVWLVPDYYNLLVYGGQVSDLGGISLISLKAPTLTGYQRMLKRMFDLVVGLALFLLLFPLMIMIALMIRLDSPGKVLLKQERVGENRRVFKMYKFRSMVSGAEDHLDEMLRIDEVGRLQHKIPNDPRVTRLGRFLRRTSLDELPQLWNVLRGEMSLVGPRPELPVLVAQYEPWQQKRFAVPQGMTGWWQVNGRSDRPMHLHTQDDLYYVQHYSILLDLEILLKTAWVVLRGRGAF